MRSLYSAVKRRRSGRSGTAGSGIPRPRAGPPASEPAAVAGVTSVGLRPPSVTPATACSLINILAFSIAQTPPALYCNIQEAGVSTIIGTEGPVMMLVVLPVKELRAEALGVFETVEAGGELRAVLEGLKLALGERVVIGDVRAAVRLDDAQRCQQLRDSL